MKQKNIECHDFHFKMDVDTRGELKGLDLCKEAGGVSGLIVKILQELNPRLEKEHFEGEQHLSRYEVVHPDMEVARVSVHAYLPVELYRRLKLMHQHM